MRNSISAFAFVMLAAMFLAACGSSPSAQQSSGTGTVPMSLTISDNPPAGVTVLSFQIEITGASLLPSNPSEQPVSLIAKPEDVELEHLQTESALLANINVPAGTYNGVTVTFASPQMTILNQTGATLTVGNQKCANMQICEITPTLNAASVTVQAPTQPFPITLSANSPVVLGLDFNLNASIQQSNLSITPTISVSELPALAAQQQERMHLIGQITAVDQTNQTFTLTDELTGNSYTISTNSNTDFDFGPTCSAENFSCLQTNQIVIVHVVQTSSGTLLATKVELFAPPIVSQMTVEGVVTGINTSSSSFQIVVGYEGEFTGGQMQPIPGITTGIPLTVDVALQATFAIDTDNLTLPSGLSFASLNDMMVGQTVRVHVTAFSAMGTPPSFTITVDQIRLEPSEVTATITAINTSVTPQTFTLGNLPPLFTNSGTSTLQVDVLSTTFFCNVSGLDALSSGDYVSVAGLLFKTTSTPIMVAEAVFKRQPQQD